ncbi:hypothetical protein [Atlantibacter subterraneus]|uniref:hypothetical protein n=1 Tax=Atlantibacter subterraneus TaxID=255519 RepID=UPI0028A98A04|nr:hypothetical protein [Atlantibacter subterranea]
MTINERVSPETLEKIIEAADEVITALAGTNEDVHKNDSAKMCQLWDDLNDRHATPAIVKALARELQQYRAAAEPVAWLLSGGGAKNDVRFDSSNAYADPLREVTPLYAAPQVTRVPDEWRMMCGDWRDENVSIHDASGLIVSGISPNAAGIIIDAHNACRAAMLAAPAVQAEQLSGNTEQVSQPYTLPEHSPCADAPDHIWLQTAGEWPASGEFSELTWGCDNQHPDDTLYVRADLVGKYPCYLQGYKDGCEWSALMAEANHPQTGDWLFDDPIELAKAIRKGPDMLPSAPKQEAE